MSNIALIEAVKSKSFQDVYNLLENGADINEYDEQYATALHYAVSQQYNNLNVIKLILQFKPNVHAVSQFGSPLDIAVRYSMGLHAVQALISSGASPNFISKRGQFEKQTPLHYAAIYGTAEIIKLLVKKGANPNVLDGTGNSPLHWAVSRYDAVEALLVSGASPSLTGASRITPLHNLVTMGDEIENVATAELLIKHGAKVNATECLLKQTPLHYAAKDGYYRLCQCLIKHGASLLLEDAYKKCAGQIVPEKDRHMFDSFSKGQEVVFVEPKTISSLGKINLKECFACQV